MRRVVRLRVRNPNAEPALAYPATRDDIALLAEFLETNREQQLVMATQLQRRLQALRQGCRGQVTCERPNGLYVLLPIPLALWLLAALEAGGSIRKQLVAQLTP